MRNLSYCVVVLILAVSLQAEAAKGIIIGTGSGGSAGKLLAFVNGTTQVYHFSSPGYWLGILLHSQVLHHR